MPQYNITSSKNYVIYTDQTGSALYDSGGPSGPYGPNENLYVLIAPEYSTGTLTLNVTEFRSENTFDTLRIYNGIPPTSSFAYSGIAENSQLIKILTGTPSLPVQVTASAGKAYIRWYSDSSVQDNGFAIEWTGSGFYDPGPQYGTINNQYALTLPKDSTTGSYMTFAVGALTSSAVIGENKDIAIGFWGKPDLYEASAPEGPVIGIGEINGGQTISIVRKASPSTGDNSFRIYYRDSSGSVSALSLTSTDIVVGGQITVDRYPPQWHHYGFVIEKLDTAGNGTFLAYKDGALFTSGAISNLGGRWGSISTTYDMVVGSYRDLGGTILNGGVTRAAWSGSLDDMFLLTVNTGSGEASFTDFFSRVYNSGNWADPTLIKSESFSLAYDPKVVFNWRFEEAGVLATYDYGDFGNIHTASFRQGITGKDPIQTSVESGISYTPYSNLSYTPPGDPSFTSASYTTGESSGSITIYVDRISGSAGELTVNYLTLDGTAASGTNYTQTTGGLTWSAGDVTTKSFSVPILYDQVQTSDLDFTVNLTSAFGSFQPYAVTSSTVTIQDQEPGTFYSRFSENTVVEGASLSFTVLRRSGSFGEVTVFITSSNGTAISGVDYNAVSGSVVFPDGDTTNKSLTVTTIDNGTDVSGSLYFTVGIAAVSASYGTGLTGSPTYTTINITDNETGSFRFTNSSQTSSLGSTITIPVERYSGSDFAATATIGVQGGTAVAGTHYTNIFPYTVTWADQISGTVNITLETLDIDFWAGSRTLVLTASSFTNIGVGTPATCSILMESNILTQSASPYPNVGTDFTINSYLNLSTQYTRVVQQVPFSLGAKGPRTLRGRTTAASSSL